MNHLERPRKFSLLARLKSFAYAYNGILYCIKTQHNAWIHLFITSLVIIFAFFFGVSWIEWCCLMLAIGLVMMAEIFNTAIEELVDMICPEYNPKAGIIKDLASGAVLVMAFCSAVVGGIIFLPRFWALFIKIWSPGF